MLLVRLQQMLLKYQRLYNGTREWEEKRLKMWVSHVNRNAISHMQNQILRRWVLVSGWGRWIQVSGNCIREVVRLEAIFGCR